MQPEVARRGCLAAFALCRSGGAAGGVGSEHEGCAFGNVSAWTQIRSRDGVEEDVEEAGGGEDEVGEDCCGPWYAAAAP